MQITKVGHCCLVIEVAGVRIMTDPGDMSTGQTDVRGLHAVLITHEHGDHLHVESLKEVLSNNPKARVITNKAVSAILQKEEIASEIVGNGQYTDVNGLTIEGNGTEHAKVYENQPDVENTGYFIGDKFFYPGDSFFNPGKDADILALPVGGPWMKIQEALMYAKQMKPRVCFPVHDGMFNEPGLATAHRWPASVLPKLGIQFVSMKEGSSETF